MSKLLPVIVPLNSREVVPGSQNKINMTLARTLTHSEHGSNIMVGVSWMEPGEQSHWWSTETEAPAEGGFHHIGPVHEFFYLIDGHCTIDWNGEKLAFGPGDTVFFAPEWRYRITNTGTTKATLVYASNPPLA